ncbi:MAG: type I DNA topoisomerase [Candidatus Melainabacteria bacterium]|nr:type I DNA topoisomerase [Candidatus Melainabacteria bacterium]
MEDSQKYLVIVESPAKAKTISKILGKEFLVKASIGHVRDLPKNRLGVNVRKNFEPQYEILREKEPIVAELREAALEAKKVYLAPDPDREGEAIAWHLSELLELPKNKLHRIEFNEITKEAVLAAIKSPRQIDKRLVDAQQARRVLDRLVGYKISPLLWRKVNGRSAGRVQSVAVRLICEREVDVVSFDPKEYWSIKASLNKAKAKQSFVAPLYKWKEKRVIAASDKATANSMVIESEKEAKQIVKAIEGQDYKVISVTEKSSQRKPQPPFITSTLQREAANALGYPVKKTMQIAQSLYEGVELGPDGATGLITYMRTDSTRVSQQAQDDARTFIEAKYGKDYIPAKPWVYTRKAKNVQDAHEAIRPSYPDKVPEDVKKYLTSDQFKLYKLIWQRFMASQMSQVKLQTTSVEIGAGDAIFRASATEKKFDGFTVVYDRAKPAPGDGDEEPTEDGESQEEHTENLPTLKKNEELKLKDLDPGQHFTQPPPRYSEATLVKTLEELGIGRPSTYSATVTTIIDRKYVERLNKALAPTKLGQAVNLLLVEHFGNIVDVSFTANMEAKLDQIEEDQVDWHGMLKEFYLPFGETLKKAEENMNKVIILSDHICPACGLQMAIRSSRFGQFLGCIGYPECKTKIALTKDGLPVPEDRPSEEKCTTCGSDMLVRYGRYGDYLACSVEECKEQRPILKTTGVMCPREGCGGAIVEKKSRRGKIFYGCSNYSQNQCTSAYWYSPVISGGPYGKNTCPTCHAILLYKTLKRGDQVQCSNKECTFAELATGTEIHAGARPPAEPAPAGKA